MPAFFVQKAGDFAYPLCVVNRIVTKCSPQNLLRSDQARVKISLFPKAFFLPSSCTDFFGQFSFSADSGVGHSSFEDFDGTTPSTNGASMSEEFGSVGAGG